MNRLQVLCIVMLAITLLGAGALGLDAVIAASVAAIWAFHFGRLRTGGAK